MKKTIIITIIAMIALVSLASAFPWVWFQCYAGNDSWSSGLNEPSYQVIATNFMTDYYQEDANETFIDANWDSGGMAVIDGNWATGDGAGGTGYVFVNYTKPALASSAVWKVSSDYFGDFNLTLPTECWNADPNKLILSIASHSSVTAYEEGIYWNYFNGGDGTGGNPYQITTCLQLNEIRNDLTANYILMNNINCSDTINWNEGLGWIQIPPFNGSLNGNDFIISNLYAYNNDGDLMGLFYTLETGAYITRLGLEELSLTGGRYVGGIVGQNYGTITYSHTTGYLTGRQDRIGGIAGYNAGLITNSYTTAGLSSNGYIGGFVGQNDATGIINNSYSTGGGGGIEGGAGFSSDNYGIIQNSYSLGSVSGMFGCQGFVRDNGGTIISSYWDTEASGCAESGGGTGKTTAEMMNQSTFIDWDFLTIWTIDEGISYPELMIFEEPECVDDYDCDTCYVCNAGTCEYQTHTDLKIDCGFCQWCDGTGSCENQDYAENIKNECNLYYECEGNTGFYGAHIAACDGSGSCIFMAHSGFVSEGNVCINSTDYDVNPTASVNCGMWRDCVVNETSADEYYVGYHDDMSGDCSDIDWVSAGTNWTPTGYKINVSEHAANCSVQRIPSGGGGGAWPEEITPTTLTPTPSGPTTFSLAGFLLGRISLKDLLWHYIKSWLAGIGKNLLAGIGINI